MRIRILSILGAIVFFAFTVVIAIDLVFPIEYSDIVKKYCRQYSVDASLALAVIWTESKFDPDARSGAGACGLMQLMPSTAKWLAGDDYDEQRLFEPEYNIWLGVAYLSYLGKSFEGDYLLAAYNAGEGNVREWQSSDGEIHFSETRSYVKKVNTVRRIYAFRIGS